MTFYHLYMVSLLVPFRLKKIRDTKYLTEIVVRSRPTVTPFSPFYLDVLSPSRCLNMVTEMNRHETVRWRVPVEVYPFNLEIFFSLRIEHLL